MLPPHEVLASRFRVIRFIAHGGMGRVYEAEDMRLRERVALKTLRPFLASSSIAQERFRREVQLARRVTHPNVCRIFDLGVHPHPEPLAFVTMELLDGQTLAERLERTGRMTLEQALPLIEQMAAGLSAAHAAGVVHRDFKTANVMLVPGSGGERAVVTDFGLARSVEGDDSVTGSGAAVGTLHSMAPEQFAGDDATPRSDVYSLGIVMYEMAAGVKPFEGGTGISGVVRRLREAAPSPREHARDVDRRWADVILRCLERDPADRFGDAFDVVRALRGEKVQAERRVPAWVPWALVGLSIALAAAVVWRTKAPAPSPAAPASLLSRRSVAVLGFQNLSGRADAAWLATALSEMLSAELAIGEDLRTVAGETVARSKRELGLDDDVYGFGAETLARIRENTSADLVVVGSYVAVPSGAGDLRVDVRVQDARHGETLATISESGRAAELLGLVTRVGARLRATLGAPAHSPEESKAVEAALPTNPEAAKLYAEGLARLRGLDALGARDLLQKAVAADPSFPLAHAALASAWDRLGYDGEARASAEKAFELSKSLSREHRLVVEGRYREATREWPRAIEIYKALVAFFPDDLDYGLRLAAAQSASGAGRDALRTIEALRALPPPSGDDPQVDLVEVEAASTLGEYRRMQAVAKRAGEKGLARGAKLLVARARAAEAVAGRQLADYAGAAAAAQEAQRIFGEVGDLDGKAWALNSQASVLRNQGDLLGARRRNEEALAIFRTIGNQRGSGQALNSLAAVLVFQGQVRAARTMWEQALALHRELGDKQHAAYQLNNLAGSARQLGRLAVAQREYDEALALCQEIGDTTLPRAIHHGLGLVHLDRGELEGARRSFEQARAISEAKGEKRFLAYAVQGLGDVALARGELDEAGRHFDEALAIRTGLGEKLTIAESRIALALLQLERGQAAEAERGAREAAQAFMDEGAPQDAGWARAVQALALVAAGRAEEAGSLAPASPSEQIHKRTLVRIAEARVLAARGRTPEAQRTLETALEEVQAAGVLPETLLVRLALAELPGGAQAARRQSLRKDAEAAGFLLVARKAAR